FERIDGGVGGDDDDRRFRAAPPQRRERGEAVAFGHHQVEDDDIRWIGGGHREALVTVTGLVDDRALAFERSSEQQTNVRLVVADEHPHSCPLPLRRVPPFARSAKANSGYSGFG